MKILFIDHIEGDFIAGTLFLGFCQEYGPENVVDWPYKGSYHGETDRYPSVYGPEHGEGMTGPFDWFPAQPGVRRTDDEVFEQIGTFDLVVAGIRGQAVAALRKLIGKVGRKAIRKLALFDGQDSDSMPWSIAGEFLPEAFFKRELLRYSKPFVNNVPSMRLLPCPFACVLPKPRPVSKAIDVTDLGAGNFFPGVGKKVLFDLVSKDFVDSRLKKEFGDKFTGGHVGYREFLELTNQSKIAVCFGGYGWDAFRHSEIPAFEGTLLLRNRSPQIMPHPFVNGETCAEFSTLEEMVSVIRGYLDDDAKRERVALAGNALLWEHHTAKARARYIAEETIR